MAGQETSQHHLKGLAVFDAYTETPNRSQADDFILTMEWVIIRESTDFRSFASGKRVLLTQQKPNRGYMQKTFFN